jgi:hypothetical protein
MESAAAPSLHKIRERAYDLWDRHHRPDGFDLHWWFMAERELKAERRAKLEHDAGPEGDETSHSTKQDDTTASAESAS